VGSLVDDDASLLVTIRDPKEPWAEIDVVPARGGIGALTPGVTRCGANELLVPRGRHCAKPEGIQRSRESHQVAGDISRANSTPEKLPDQTEGCRGHRVWVASEPINGIVDEANGSLNEFPYLSSFRRVKVLLMWF
jgi:hypothetical protein